MCRDKHPNKWIRKSVTTIFPMSQHKGLNIEEELCRDNEAAIRNQVKWRQDSIATDFLGRDRNTDNTRNIVATRTNRNAVTT